MKEPLINVFDNSLGYAFEKVRQAVCSGSYDNFEFGKSMLEIIKNTHENFQNKLLLISELNDSLEYELNEYFHAISKLDAYFTNRSSEFVEFDAGIYLYFIEENHKYFVEVAKEIDNKYKDKNVYQQ